MTRAIIKTALTTLLILTLLHVFSVCFTPQHDSMINLWNMGREKNFPTIFQTALFIINGVALRAIAKGQKEKGLRIFFISLSYLFYFLSLDEWFSIHDALGVIGEWMYHPDFPHAWLIPYALIMPIFFILCIKSLLNLPRKTAIMMIISGSIFVMGAMGFEYLNSIKAPYVIKQTIQLCEELFESLGLILFLKTLFDYMPLIHLEGRLSFSKVWTYGLLIFAGLDIAISQWVFLH